MKISSNWLTKPTQQVHGRYASEEDGAVVSIIFLTSGTEASIEYKSC
jgi:hypothetical protein